MSQSSVLNFIVNSNIEKSIRLWVMGLTSRDPEVREWAYRALYQSYTLEYIDDTWLHIALILFESLQDKKIPTSDIVWLLSLCTDMAFHLESEIETPQRSEIKTTFLSLVSENLHVFLDLLEEIDEYDFQAIINIVSCLPDKNNLIIENFITQFSNQKVQQKIGLLIGMYRLLKDKVIKDNYKYFFMNQLNSPSELVRITCAIILSSLFKGDIPNTVDKILIDAIAYEETISRPAYAEMTIDFWINVILNFNVNRAINILILSLNNSYDRKNIEKIVLTMLLTVFNNREKVSYSLSTKKTKEQDIQHTYKIDLSQLNSAPQSNLNLTQARVLKAIVNHESFFKYNNNLLDIFSLPNNQDDLRQLIK